MDTCKIVYTDGSVSTDWISEGEAVKRLVAANDKGRLSDWKVRVLKDPDNPEEGYTTYPGHDALKRLL